MSIDPLGDASGPGDEIAAKIRVLWAAKRACSC